MGFGSNEGDRVQHLRAAKSRILAMPGVRLIGQSSLYETEPVGVKPEYQHLKFLNAVIVVASSVPLLDLQQNVMAIELDGGRRRSEDKFAPRPLDIDILFAGDAVMNTPSLKLPHPQCFKRRFVLAPLAEIMPGLVLPTASRCVADLLNQLPGQEQVVKLPGTW